LKLNSFNHNDLRLDVFGKTINGETMDTSKQRTMQRIAREVLSLETLQTRNSDRLDFREQAVWQIAKALSEAYEAGRAAAPLSAKTDKSKTRSKP
jgi:hypothetical protein